MRSSLDLWRPKALVVDDEPVARMVAADRLAALGAEVIEASDGAEAMAVMMQHDFDAAIIDLDMPRINGFDLISCIRGHPRTRHLPIIVLTGCDSPQSMHRALTAGATSYILKPLNWSAFGEHVRHVLGLVRPGARSA